MVTGPGEGLPALPALSLSPPLVGMTNIGGPPPTDGAQSSPHVVLTMPPALGMSMGMALAAEGVGRGEPVKRKRGRPRKYTGTDGGGGSPANMQLVLQSPAAGSTDLPHTPGSEKRARGRPPGSGKKQQLGALGTARFSSTA